jgi:hypothetical protein
MILWFKLDKENRIWFQLCSKIKLREKFEQDEYNPAIAHSKDGIF